MFSGASLKIKKRLRVHSFICCSNNIAWFIESRASMLGMSNKNLTIQKTAKKIHC